MVDAEFNLFPVKNLFSDPYRHLLLTAEEQIILLSKFYLGKIQLFVPSLQFMFFLVQKQIVITECF